MKVIYLDESYTFINIEMLSKLENFVVQNKCVSEESDDEPEKILTNSNDSPHSGQ